MWMCQLHHDRGSTRPDRLTCRQPRRQKVKEAIDALLITSLAFLEEVLELAIGVSGVLLVGLDRLELGGERLQQVVRRVVYRAVHGFSPQRFRTRTQLA